MFKFIRVLPRNMQQSRFEFNIRYLAFFKPRDILTETSDETGTLLTRFAKHLALETHKLTPLVPTTIRYVDYFPISEFNYFMRQLKKTPAEQIPALIIFSSTYRPNADPAKFAEILNAFDSLALEQLPKMDADTILRTLYALVFVVPNWVTRFDFHYKATQRLVEDDFSEDVDKEKFIQLCFYLGLSKKQNNSQKLLEKFLGAHLEKHLDELSSMDFALVCNAAYKTSTPVQSDKYNERLKSEVLKLQLENLDDSLLVTFIKAMRFQRIQSIDICEYLSSLCKNEVFIQKLQMRGLVHVFAYFSENLWDDESVLDPVVMNFLSNLGSNSKFSRVSESIRAKDMATFLWCCAQLNYKLAESDLDRIETILLNKARDNEFRFYPDQLVDSCLSLWSLGKQSRELLQCAIDLKSQRRPNAKEQPKVDSRFTILLSITSIEEPTWLEEFKKLKINKPINLSAAAPDYISKQRVDIKTFAEKLAQDENVASTKLICPIAGINIPSILVETNTQTEKLFIELLNDKQVLHFSKSPVNIMRIKERLLRIAGYKVVVVNSSELAKDFTNVKDLVFTDSNDITADTKTRSSQKN